MPESIRKSRCQSRMRPENGGEGTIQTPSAWLPNGAGCELASRSRGDQHKTPYRARLAQLVEQRIRNAQVGSSNLPSSSTVRLGDALFEKPPKKLPTGACTCWRLAKSCRKSSAPEPDTNGQRKASHGRALSATVHDNSKQKGDDTNGAGNYQCRRYVHD